MHVEAVQKDNKKKCSMIYDIICSIFIDYFYSEYFSIVGTDCKEPEKK